MGFVKNLVLLIVVVAVIGLVAYDPTRTIMHDVFVYTVAPAFISAKDSITGSLWWQQYQLAIVVPPVFILGIFLTAMYYKGKIHMWQWGAKKAVETAYGTKQPAPAPTPLAAAPIPIPVEPEAKPTA